MNLMDAILSWDAILNVSFRFMSSAKLRRNDIFTEYEYYFRSICGFHGIFDVQRMAQWSTDNALTSAFMVRIPVT